MINCRCRLGVLDPVVRALYSTKKRKPHFYKKSIWPTRCKLLGSKKCAVHKKLGGYELFWNSEYICTRYSYWATVDAAVFILLKRGLL